MEVIFVEDPACSWCWAFQPVETAFLFEYGDSVPWRSILGGLRDHPVPDVTLVKRHWSTAAAVSGMPFEPAIWDRHILRTTFLASKVVKAASLRGKESGRRFLRRVREAFYVESLPIDDLQVLLGLAAEQGLDCDDIVDQLSSGRAEALFDLDRRDAAGKGFGFPTTLIRRHALDEPVVLQGAVTYDELRAALEDADTPVRERRRFQDTDADWDRLLAIRPRLAEAEIRLVTGLEPSELEARGLERQGPFWVRRDEASPSALASESARLVT